MKITSSYKVQIKQYRHIFDDTVRIYRDAVDFLISVCLENWNEISALDGMLLRKSYVENLIHKTKEHPHPKYEFDAVFYKFPSYLRRDAIACAIGKVSSHKSSLSNWEASDMTTRGAEPGIPKAGFEFPCMYKTVMYQRTDEYSCKVKVWIRNTWDWISLQLRKSDVDYIRRHCADRKECAPVLQKRGKRWLLRFCFEEQQTLSDTDVFDQRIVAVDLGLNHCCVCSVMRSDGTIIGRHFLRLPEEYDCLKRKTDHIRRAQSHGSRRVGRLWRFANGVNDAIAVKTAQFIIDIAVLYQADVIVMEHLNFQNTTDKTSKRKKKSRSMRLHLWKAQTVQDIVENKAHRLGIHIARVCAWGTSRLAFDGSGKVLRGKDSTKTNNNYSLCEFQNGKIYHCDLNASYNIGARYFIREIRKSIPVTEWQCIAAKVPECMKRSTCTLSTLRNLCSALYEPSYNGTAIA